MTLRHKTAQAILWSLTGQWGRQFINFIIFLILSRLLEPKTFGLVALATVFTAFFQIFVDQGLSEAIVQIADLDKEYLDTSFWVNILMGSLMTVLGVALSTPIAIAFNEPALLPILRTMSLIFLIAGLSSTQEALLKRELAFRSLAIRSLVAMVFGGGAGIVLALLGYGVWSLVAQLLVDGTVRTIILWRVTNWQPGFHFSWPKFRELYIFGVNIVGSKALNFFNRRSDDFLIGYYLGPVALGYYTIAYRLLVITTNLIGGLITSVAFPTLSRLQKDPERMRQAFYMATQFTSLVSFPIFLGMSVLAPELITVLFGEKWLPSVPVMRILAFIGILHCVFYFNSSVLMAVGKSNWKLILTAINAIANVVFFLIFVRWGIVAVAFAYVLRGYLLAPLPFRVVNKFITIDPFTYLRQYIVPLMGSLMMILAILVLKYFLSEVIPLSMQLIVFVVIGGVTYIGYIRLLSASLYFQGLDLLRLALPLGKVPKL